MKVTITLSEAEVMGIKAYLREVDGIENPNREDVSVFMCSYVDIINAPQEAVSDYIRQAREQLANK